MLRVSAILIVLTGLASAQQLTIQSATARSVGLAWTGLSGPVTVERTAGTVTQKVATTEEGSYEDKSIDAFATYRYRVSAGGKTSNSLTVGPPPRGVINAAPVPKGADPGKYGQASAIALDDNGDPVIAFEWVDPNGDNEYSDNEIDFVRWSRAEYRWLAPVRVQVVGEISNQNLNPVSIAWDAKTRTFAIVTPVKDNGASILLSSDLGAHWNARPLPGIAGNVSATALAIAGGAARLALVSADSGVRYISGPIDDLSSWKNEAAPTSSGWKQLPGVNVALTLDGAGNPVLSWLEAREEGEGNRFQVWRPGSAAITAIQTANHTDSPSVGLRWGGGKLGLIVAMPLDEKDTDHAVWYAQSTDGASWSKPSKPPVDGPRTTNAPVSVAIDSRGRIVAVFGSNGGGAGTACNYPVLSRSTDGIAWKTCGPGKAEGGDFTPQPSTLHVIEAGDDKAYVLWQEPSENKFRPGMLVWHER